MSNPAAGCYDVGGVVLPCTWSSLDVFEFFVWGPARNAAASAPSESSLATWVPAKRVVPINLPNPFDQYVDVPVERIDTTYTPGYWRYAHAPSVNITFAQRPTAANPQNPTAHGPCELMAQFAQDEANFVMTDVGGGTARALPEFDRRFAAFYLGRDSGGHGRPMRTLQDVLHYGKGGGTRNRLATGERLGQ